MASQTPNEFDITFVQGDDYLLDVVAEEDGTAIDFSGHSSESLQVREYVGGPLLDEYTTSEGTLTTTAGGGVSAKFTATQTAKWPETCTYEMQSDKANGDRRTWIRGTLTAQRQTNEAT